MIKITAKTLSDLEFPTVCQQVSRFTVTVPGKEKALNIVPFSDYEKTISALHQTNEYVSSYQQESRIPNHGFDAIEMEIKMLGIEDTILEASSLRKIGAISETANTQIKFFEKFEEIYPALRKTTGEIEFTPILIEKITKVIDRFGEVKD